ncbi:MAG: PqqD family protein [Candidatus Lustribacter sp.]
MNLTEPLTRDEMLSLRPDVVATVLDEGAILLDLDTKYFFALNSSGWAIVQLFESAASLDDARSFATASGAPEDESVELFLNRLHEYGLFEAAADDAVAAAPTLEIAAAWLTPTVERQSEPLQQVIVSAFDPSIPLAE